jgi:alanyl-tRNA synthetase
MQSAIVRDKFLNFFESKGHQLVDSAPLVVKNDPTLMFTNAGMNQFKDIFLGNEPSKFPRIADTQKCLRVSGKHNDLEEVGVDTYHHTMFEMLGNWSFGDYYKAEAIGWAWELLTKVYGVDKERLYVTVFKGDEADGLSFDQEAYDVWKGFIAEERIIAAGKKDNFWEMGEVGPCGPCSEVHVDMRSDAERKAIPGKNLVNNDHPQVIEIWNLVFMELQRRADGNLIPLKAKHIDTGMGFERLCMVLQGKSATYDTDIFSPLIAFAERETGKKYHRSDSKQDVAFRVLADHVRAVSFAIADGQMPSNTGAGYVIRRILRRAVRYAYSFLDRREPLLSPMADVLVEQMGSFFKGLRANHQLIKDVIREEEESFLRTLAKGIQLIDELLASTQDERINGEVVFELYDTFGFPADLTALILSEHGRTYDEAAFSRALEAQKQRSRSAGAQDTGDWVVLADHPSTQFVGYDTLEADIQLARYRAVTQKGKALYQMVFDRSPFYPEGGGQAGDRGYLIKGAKRLPVIGTFRENNLIVHLSNQSPEGFSGTLKAVVDAERRSLTAKNHSATHLLHHALRELLGKHVEQKGSLVEKDYLRFDFSHFSKVSDEEIREVERRVNASVRRDVALDEYRNISMAEAKAMGAMALFGEKYGDSVRAIRFGESVELCGGTHVKATGEIGFFKIVSEGSVAAGIRRIEALTAEAAEEHIFERLDLADAFGEKLKNPRESMKALDNLMAENSLLQKEVEQLRREKALGIKNTLREQCRELNGINFIAAKVDLDAHSIKDVAYVLRAEIDRLFLILASAENDKATLSVALSDELVASRGMNAGKIVRELALLIKGGGGGQAFFATAGGTDPSGIAAALMKAEQMLSSQG